MEIRFTDADGFDQSAEGADLAVIVFTRNEVEGGFVSGAIERLMLFSDGADHVRRFAGRVTLLFSGYDDDQRPLPEIPECVRFFRSVDSQWSYWLHFLLPDSEALQLAILLRVNVSIRTRGSIAVGYQLRDPLQLLNAVNRWFEAMNVLHDAHGIDEAFNKAQTSALVEAIKAWM